MINNLQTEVLKIEDKKVREITIDYISQILCQNDCKKDSRYINRLMYLIELLRHTKLSELCWDHLCLYINLYKKNNISKVVKNYYFYLYTNYKLDCIHYNYIIQNIWILNESERVKHKILFRINQDPRNIIRIKINNKSTYTFFDLSCENKFLRLILKEFIEKLPINELNMTRLKLFTTRFEDSFVEKRKIVSSIKDINYSLFVKQYSYFKELDITACTENSSSVRMISYLTKFYLMLLEKIKNEKIDHEIFLTGDGIDSVFLLRRNFSELFGSGYRVVYYNRFDEVPIIDKWLIAPNGMELSSTKLRHNTYIIINFSVIRNPSIKKLIKHYIWYGDKGLVTLEIQFRILKVFTNFMEVLYPHSNNRKLFLTLNDILSFKLYILDNYSGLIYQNKILQAVSSLLKHGKSKGLVDFHDIGLDYLKIIKGESFCPTPLKKEELEVLINSYKSAALDNNLERNLEWIVIQLCLTTNLRISEILNLKVNNIKYSIDSPVSINTRRKGSGRVEKSYYPDERVVRLLEKAILLTNELRNLCDEKIRDYIFLVKGIKSSIGVFKQDTISKNFKKKVRENKFEKDYSIYNLRDTFMSLIYDKGLEEGRSLLEIHNATGHLDLSTTRTHYRQPTIKSYLEATYCVTVGEVELQGNIIEDSDKNNETLTYERQVNQRCGYCSHNYCINERDIDCLLCPSFITTQDRIPYFKAAINRIDSEIEMLEDDFEKRELISIKELHVSYLNALFLLVK